MVSVLASSAGDRGFDRQPAQTKDYVIASVIASCVVDDGFKPLIVW